MQDREIILDSSSEESIVGEQANKLFEICDKDEKGYITRNDLNGLSEFVSLYDIQEIQRKVDETKEKQITREQFAQIIRDLVSCQNNNYESASEVSRTKFLEIQALHTIVYLF
ncbi:hypothetical protein COOONC_19205 [Cooperia oncophora]